MMPPIVIDDEELTLRFEDIRVQPSIDKRECDSFQPLTATEVQIQPAIIEPK